MEESKAQGKLATSEKLIISDIEAIKSTIETKINELKIAYKTKKDSDSSS
jgi:hypothetical protein